MHKLQTFRLILTLKKLIVIFNRSLDMKRNKSLYLLTLAMALTGCSSNEIQLDTDAFALELDETGRVTGLIDKVNGTNYVPEEATSHLLLLRVDTTFYEPQAAQWLDKGHTLELKYPECGATVTVNVDAYEKYLKLEIADYQSEQPVDVALWGPYATSISRTVGECVGVVRDSLYAIGIQALNAKTLGGYPSEESDVTPSYNIFASTSLVDVDKDVKVLYRGQTAMHKDFGSVIQAYCRNRDEDRVIANWHHTHYVSPAYADGGIVGSKIALFGCPEPETLDYIEAIELGENLPHPTLDGVWGKKSPVASQAYIIYPFNENNIHEALAFTKKTGLKYLYNGGPFAEWGHFALNPAAFPSGWDGLKKCVDIAAAEGIKLGVHTLSNFITTNDPYVTPVPDRRLAMVGASTLTRDIDEAAGEIEIADPTFFNQMANNNLHAVRIGDELVRYERVSETAPWKLLNCTRGAWGTRAAAHSNGEEIVKLMDHGYKTFLTNTELTLEMARRLADLFNQTGIRQISFDGLEGCNSTGMGDYGVNLMMQEWYSHLKPEYRDNINDASMTTHFNWHIFTRMNWGEPWYAGFRESQVTYRLMNQDFYRRNLIPCMLGWFKLDANTSLEDINWLLARSAAFDAGYTLVTDGAKVAANGQSEAIITAIREWEKARLGDAFPPELKKEMEHLANEYVLEATGADSWNLYACQPVRQTHRNAARQPGEPVVSKWTYNNRYERQPLRFLLKANDTVDGLTLEIGNFSTVEIPVTLQPGQWLKYDGGDAFTVYDGNWNALQTLPAKAAALVVPEGETSLNFSCHFASPEDTDKAVTAEFKTYAQPVHLKINNSRL